VTPPPRLAVYYKLDGSTAHTVVSCSSLYEWVEWFESADRVVRQEERAGVRLSTVFLGIDHRFGDGPGPPLVFETMIFGGERDGDCWRYATWDEAESGHRKRARELWVFAGDA
jgi:hypothetical protein